MSGTVRARATAAAFLILLIGPMTAQTPPPELTAPVNDFANVIDPDSEAALDSLIRKLQAASGDVIIVATVQTFQPYADIQSYANEMFENRGKGIGQKGKDNGLLLVLAVDDRQVWSEVGYDLEGIITDGFAGETSRQVMVPFFWQGNFGRGLLAGATRYTQRIAQARNVTLEGLPAQPAVDDEDEEAGFPFILVLFLFIVGINILRSIMGALLGRGKRRRRGGRWTSSVGPFGPGYGGWSGGGGWSGSSGGFGGGFGGFGGGRSGGGGGGASW